MRTERSIEQQMSCLVCGTKSTSRTCKHGGVNNYSLCCSKHSRIHPAHHPVVACSRRSTHARPTLTVLEWLIFCLAHALQVTGMLLDCLCLAMLVSLTPFS